MLYGKILLHFTRLVEMYCLYILYVLVIFLIYVVSVKIMPIKCCVLFKTLFNIIFNSL
jgi:hypothetical protein